MKKLIPFFIIVCLVSLALVAPTTNWWRYIMIAHGGLKIGRTVESSSTNKAGSYVLKIDSVTTDNTTTPTLFKLYHAGVQLIPDIPVGSQIDGATVYTKLQPDSVQHTAAYTVGASDIFKDQMCIKATGSMAITIPANLTEWPVGTWMNFLQEGGAILVFKKASGVRFAFPKDSIATAYKSGTVSIKKIGINAYYGVGSLTD